MQALYGNTSLFLLNLVGKVVDAIVTAIHIEIDHQCGRGKGNGVAIEFGPGVSKERS